MIDDDDWLLDAAITLICIVLLRLLVYIVAFLLSNQFFHNSKSTYCVYCTIVLPDDTVRPSYPNGRMKMKNL